MLVLTRKVGEEIVIDHRVTVQVADIQGGKVRLAVKAPRDIAVNRKEIEDLVMSTEEAR